MTALIALGGFGGVVLLVTAIVIMGRGIFKMVSATEENTEATKKLAESITRMEQMFNDLNTRVTVLEDRIKR